MLSLNLTGELKYSSIFLMTYENPKSLFWKLYLIELFTTTVKILFSGINKSEQTKGPFQSLLFVCVLGEIKRSGQIFPMSKFKICHLT